MRRLTSKKFMEGASGKPLKISNAVVERFLERHHATNEELMRELGGERHLVRGVWRHPGNFEQDTRRVSSSSLFKTGSFKS